MPEQFDFSELRNYLQGQIELGGNEVFFDEPWQLKKKTNQIVTPIPNIKPPSSINSTTKEKFSTKENFTSTQKPNFTTSVKTPTPRVVSKTSSPFENAKSLPEFYELIRKETLYANGKNLWTYEGSDSPQVLLLLQQPHAEISSGEFFKSPVGEMLIRLFSNLNTAQSAMTVTYFYKQAEHRSFPPLLEALLRRMLSKELSLIKPNIMITFGDSLFHQIFGKGKLFEQYAGTDQEFSGVKTCSLIDAFSMVNDKRLKILTWKTHLPKCSYFKKA